MRSRRNDDSGGIGSRHPNAIEQTVSLFVWLFIVLLIALTCRSCCDCGGHFHDENYIDRSGAIGGDR
jgi:hypothetical protein